MKKLFYLLFVSSVVLVSCNKYEREIDGIWVKSFSTSYANPAILSKWEFNKSNKSFIYTYWYLNIDLAGNPTGDTTYMIINGNFDVRRRKFIYLKEMTSNLPPGDQIYGIYGDATLGLCPPCIDAFENDTLLPIEFNSDSILLPQPPILVEFSSYPREPLSSWLYRQ